MYPRLHFTTLVGVLRALWGPSRFSSSASQTFGVRCPLFQLIPTSRCRTVDLDGKRHTDRAGPALDHRRGGEGDGYRPRCPGGGPPGIRCCHTISSPRRGGDRPRRALGFDARGGGGRNLRSVVNSGGPNMSRSSYAKDRGMRCDPLLYGCGEQLEKEGYPPV